MLTERTDRAWFSRLLQHPARKWSGSILTTPKPTRGYREYNLIFPFNALTLLVGRQEVHPAYKK